MSAELKTEVPPDKAEASNAPEPTISEGDAIREELAKRILGGGNDSEDEGKKPELEASLGDSTLESDDDSDESTEQTDSLATGNKDKVPPMPPKELATAGFSLPPEIKDKYMWFRILEPRETRGFDGPYNEEDLRFMYKKGEIDDETMLWAEGRRDWEQLLYMDDLRPRLLQVPLIPPRISKGTDLEHEAFNPILTAPKKDDASGAKPLDPFLNVHAMEPRFCCSRCGSQAVGHMAGVGEAKIDMVGLREGYTIQNAQMASEVVPGIIWCGNSSAAKLNPIIDNGMTLVINCTNNMGNPEAKLPHFRTKQIPLKDKPSSSTVKEDIPMVMELFEKACDYIEVERINPERAIQADPVQEPDKLLIQTDKYGRAVKSQGERAIQLRLGKSKKVPRVMLWSKRGQDRPCVIAMAYMIRQYGISYEKAMSIVELSRPGALVCKYYKKMLQEWSRRYTKGELLCVDCVNTAKEVTTHSTLNETLLPAGGMLSETGRRAETEDPQYQNQLAAYLDMIPEGNESTKITRLGDVAVYLPKIYRGASVQSGWTGLLDLELTGRGLGDDTMLDLFEAFSRAGVCMMLRSIALRSNGLTAKGAKTLLEGLRGTLGGGLAANKTVSIKDLLAARMAGTALGAAPVSETKQQEQGSKEGPDGFEEDEEEAARRAEEEAARDMFPHLLSLDLADNDINAEGAAHLAELLKINQSLLRVDFSYNPFGDDGCKALFAAMAPPNPDFLEEPGGEKRDERYNGSLTYADFSCCGLSHYASEQLLDLFRTNKLMHTLVLDANRGFEAKDMKHVFNAIRSYSRCLQRLSLSDSAMSSKSTGYLCRILEAIEVPIKHLDLANCGLLSTPTSYLASSLGKNHHLDKLNISSNKLGEDGADRLALALYVDPVIFVPVSVDEQESTLTEEEKLRQTFVNHTEVTTYAELAEQEQTAEEKAEHKTDEHVHTLHKGVVVPGAPLVCVDVSYCSLPPPQAKAVLRALCSRPTMRIVRMSGNTVGDGIEDIIADMKMSYVVELQLNQCGLMSRSANSLFDALADTSGTEGLGGNTLGKSLRALYLANNDIHDSSVDPLGAMLRVNNLLEHLDLGFNQLSAEAGPRLREISMVTSQSSLERKLCALSVNLIGNRCDAYSMDLPGMSRAKGQFRFGVKPGGGDGLNDGYSHVPQVSRKHFFLRQAAYTDKLTQSVPGGEDATSFEQNNWRINNIS